MLVCVAQEEAEVEPAKRKGIVYASVPTFPRPTEYPVQIMSKVSDLPQPIGKIIDDIERIREELLIVQNALQKMESVQSATPVLKISR